MQMFYIRYVMQISLILVKIVTFFVINTLPPVLYLVYSYYFKYN